MLPRTLCLSVLHSNCVFCQCPRGIVTVLPRALCLSVLHSHCFFSASAWLCDSVTQDTVFRCYTQIVFFCQRPRCTVTVLPRTLSFGVTLKLCFLSVSALHRDSATRDTLSFSVTLKLCFLSVSALHRDRCYLGHFVLRCYAQVVFFVSVRVAS